MALQFRSDDAVVWNERWGDGRDGTLNIVANGEYSAAANSLTGTSSSGGTSLIVTGTTGFNNNDAVLIWQKEDATNNSYGKWQYNVIDSMPNNGTIYLKYPLQENFYVGGLVYECKQYSSVTIGTAVNYTGPTSGVGQGIIAFFCNGDFNAYGTVDVSRQGFGGGAGKPNNTAGDTGGGVLGAGVTQSNRRVNAGGGGNGGNASGGGGSNRLAGAAGKNVGGTGGQGGDAIGNAECTLLDQGGGGGSGDNHTGFGSSGAGGNGGGLILIAAKNILVDYTNFGAMLMADGGGGQYRGTFDDDNDGGGGGGGCILIKGKIIDISYSEVFAGAGGPTGGGDGGPGYIDVDWGGSVYATGFPTINGRYDKIYLDQGGTQPGFEI